jgi:hypothetical protein
MKTIFTILMVVLATNSSAKTMTVRQAIPNQIIIPSEPRPVERRAAEELARYIAIVTGKDKFPIIGESADRRPGVALVVGRTQENLKKFKPDTWPLDTIYIGYGSADDDIAIVGQGRQGTLFAAYEFLRDLGCRWYLPDNVFPDDEFIPRSQPNPLPTKPRKHTPSFYERGWHPAPASPGTWKAHLHDWAVRNGLNAFRNSPQFTYGPERGYGLDLRGGHALPALIPSADFTGTAETFAAHPEWYPLVDGKRVWQYTDGRPVQVCTSNPAVVKKAAEGIIAYFREHPHCYRFSLGHSDEPTWWCECENCRALDGGSSRWKKNDRYDAYGERSPTGPGPMSTRWFLFLNQVAAIVGNEFPDKYISALAYGSIVAPPPGDDWSLEPNVLIEFAHGDGVCHLHDYTDPTCPPNAVFNKWLSGWVDTGNRVVIWEYPPQGGKFDIPVGFVRTYTQLIKLTHEKGLSGWAGEGQGTWAGSGLWQYLKARLLWDADADVEALIHEFCRDMYGEAAEAMQTYYAEFEKKLKSLSGHPVWGAWHADLDPDSLVQLNHLLVRAGNQADTPRAERSVMMMRVAMNALILAWLEHKDNAARASDLPYEYSDVQSETLDWIKKYDVPVTDLWRDRLSDNSYLPPFEALGGSVVADLADGWRFQTDPNGTGLDSGWHRAPGAKGNEWRDISVDKYWTQQDVDFHGAGWYATSIEVPQDADGTLWLLFGMIDGQANLWINGEAAGSAGADPWDKPKGFQVSDFLKPGERVQLVLRVEKDLYAAGINDGVRLVSVQEKK